MAWVRFDDQFAFNPKVIEAGNEAAGLYARALCYCSANKTDGFVPDDISRMLAAKRVRDRCVAAGLWRPVLPGENFVISGRKDSGRRKLPDVYIEIKAHGYYIRDFLHYNWSRTDERANARADEISDDAQTSAQNGVPPTRPSLEGGSSTKDAARPPTARGPRSGRRTLDELMSRATTFIRNVQHEMPPAALREELTERFPELDETQVQQLVDAIHAPVVDTST